MRPLIIAASIIASLASAQAAEIWSCAYPSLANDRPTIKHYEVSSPDLIDVEFHQIFHIEQNNEYGIVATSSISEIEQGQTQPTVGAVSIVINKGTGEFWWVTAIAGQPAAANQPVHGKCIKE
jgi:hypothetical protein